MHGDDVGDDGVLILPDGGGLLSLSNIFAFYNNCCIQIVI